MRLGLPPGAIGRAISPAVVKLTGMLRKNMLLAEPFVAGDSVFGLPGLLSGSHNDASGGHLPPNGKLRYLRTNAAAPLTLAT